MKKRTSLKILIGFASVVALAVIATYVFFPKEKLRTLAQKKASEAAGVPVLIGGISPHFFPLGISLTNIQVGDEIKPAPIPFVTLKELSVGVEILPLLRKKLKINYLLLNEPKVVVFQTKETVPAVQKPVQKKSEDSGSFSLTLSKFNLKNGELKIVGPDGKGLLEVGQINESLSASISANEEINVEGLLTVGKMLVYTTAGTFGRDITLSLDKKINYKKKQDLLTIERGKMEFAHLPLSLSGTVQGVADENKNVDLKLTGGPANIKSILGFLPLKMFPQMEGVSSQGELSVDAMMKGLLSGKEGPLKSIENKLLDFSLKVALQRGKLTYPKLPKPIEGIELQVSANPEQITIAKCFLKTDSSQVMLSGKVTNYLKAPIADLSTKIQADLSEAQLLQPKESSMELAGKLFLEAQVKGSISKPVVHGKAELKSVSFQDKTLDFPGVSKVSGILTLNNQTAAIQSLSGNLGKSDFQISGKVVDYNTKPTFEFSMKSAQLYLDELLPKQPQKEPKKKTDLTLLEKVDGAISISAKNVELNKMKMQNVVGRVYVKDSIFDLREFSLGIFGGSVKLSGLANFKNTKAPTFDFNLGMQRVQAAEVLSYSSNLNQFGKLAGFLTGAVSTNVSFKGELDEDLNLNMNKLASKGTLDVVDTKLSNHPVQNQLASYLNAPSLKSLSLQNWTQPFEIKDGKLNISDMKLGNKDLQAKVSGSQALDGSTKMSVDLDLPQSLAAGLKSQIPQAAQSLLFDGADSRIQIPLELTGQISSPSLGVNQSKLTASLENRLKGKLQQQASDKLQNVVKDKKAEDNVKKALKKLF